MSLETHRIKNCTPRGYPLYRFWGKMPVAVHEEISVLLDFRKIFFWADGWEPVNDLP
jgi:hypothetical protein